jgi:hypothetical protein
MTDITYNLRKDEHGFFENAERSCRNCQHFLRVQPNDEPCQHALRGFCYLGDPGFTERGNYQLFISCTGAKDCPAFIIDQRKVELTVFERKLALSFNEYMDKEEPRMRRQVRKATKEILEKKPLRFIGEFFEVRSKLAQEWRSDNYKLLGYIHDNYDLKFKEYMQILDAVASFAERYVQAHPSHALINTEQTGDRHK